MFRPEWFTVWPILLLLAHSPNTFGQRSRGSSWRIEERLVEFSLDENCPVGSELGSVAAYPHQEGGGAVQSLTYRLGGGSSLFSVEPQTGQLSTSAVIDAEELCARARRPEMTPEPASKKSSPSGPLGSPPQTKPSAGGSDPVVPTDRITCSLEGQLDVHLEINALLRDGSLRAVHQVVVHIHDLNDNWPQFDQVRWHRRLKEVLYRKGRRLALPTARDADLLAEHSRILYRLESMKPEFGTLDAPFRLEITETGQPELLLTEDLDAEVRARHEFVLVAHSPSPVWSPVQVVWEAGNSQPAGKEQSKLRSKESRLLIDIEVADMNDNEPRFKAAFYNVSVAEDTSPSTVIYQLKAYDPDSTAQLFYSMGTSEEVAVMDSTFKVDADGQVRLRGYLDYEQRHTYAVNVEVSDGEFHAKTVLYVHVEDVNDEPPQFDINPKRLTAEENAPAGKLIGRVRILDSDSDTVNGQVRCHEPEQVSRRQPLNFLPEPLIQPFARVYDLTTRYTLDREDPTLRDGQLLVYLVCTDGGGALPNGGDKSKGARQHTSTMTATLTISDDNDHAPVFTQSVYHVAMTENNAIGEKVTQVNASDADEGENARITYSLLDRANFKVDSITGWITANMAFDRETRDSYQVTVVAMDHGKPRLSSSVLLNLTILDANDHRPQLASHELESSHLMKSISLQPGRVGLRNVFLVRENSPANTYIGDLIASDVDLGENAMIKFSLVKDPVTHNHMWFRLMHNGSLYTAMPLDREEKDHYQLEVRVVDQSRLSPLSSTGTIAVLVQDVNDNSPVFIEPHGLLPTNLSDGELPLWSSGNSVLFDQPAHAQDDLKVTSRTAEPSQGLKPTVRMSIHERPGYLVARLKARDADSGVNGQLAYHLESVTSSSAAVGRSSPGGGRARSGQLLRVDLVTGEVTLQQQASASDLGHHLFLVRTSDSGNPVPRTDQRLLLVSMEDIPASGGQPTDHQLAQASSYYSPNITSPAMTWWSSKNMLFLVLLISISGSLAIALVTGLLCLLGPWRGHRRHHRRGRRGHGRAGGGSVGSPIRNTSPGRLIELGSGDRLMGHFGHNGVGQGNLLTGPGYPMENGQADTLLRAQEWHVMSFEGGGHTYTNMERSAALAQLSTGVSDGELETRAPEHRVSTAPRCKNGIASHVVRTALTTAPLGPTTPPPPAKPTWVSPWIAQARKLPPETSSSSSSSSSTTTTETTTSASFTTVRLFTDDKKLSTADAFHLSEFPVTLSSPPAPPMLLLPRSNRISGIAVDDLPWGLNPPGSQGSRGQQPVDSACSVASLLLVGSEKESRFLTGELTSQSTGTDGIQKYILTPGTDILTMQVIDNNDTPFLTFVQPAALDLVNTSFTDEVLMQSPVAEHHTSSDSGRGFSEEEELNQMVRVDAESRVNWQTSPGCRMPIRQDGEFPVPPKTKAPMDSIWTMEAPGNLDQSTASPPNGGYQGFSSSALLHEMSSVE